MIASVLIFLVSVCGLGDDDAISRERIERMLADGDTDWIVQVFRRHADTVLPFVDHYLEGGLKMIEEGGDPANTADSFRRGLELAKLADKAFQEVIFTEYAASFGSWNAAEQKRFRQGQAEFRRGRKATDDPNVALAHFEKSLSLAEPLGDHWGSAMAYMGIAQTKMSMGAHEDAKKAGMKAAELNGRLRLRNQHIRARLLCGLVNAELGKPASGRGHLRIAWEQLRDSDDPKLRMKVLDAYCVALIAAGNTKLANQLREQYPHKPQPTKD